MNQLIVNAIELSRKILNAIQSKDWQTISSLDQQRQNLIQKYYQQAIAIDQKLTLELKQINDQIVAQLTELQQQTRMQHAKIKQAGKASRAYQDNLPR